MQFWLPEKERTVWSQTTPRYWGSYCKYICRNNVIEISWKEECPVSGPHGGETLLGTGLFCGFLSMKYWAHHNGDSAPCWLLVLLLPLPINYVTSNPNIFFSTSYMPRVSAYSLFLLCYPVMPWASYTDLPYLPPSYPSRYSVTTVYTSLNI